MSEATKLPEGSMSGVLPAGRILRALCDFRRISGAVGINHCLGIQMECSVIYNSIKQYVLVNWALLSSLFSNPDGDCSTSYGLQDGSPVSTAN